MRKISLLVFSLLFFVLAKVSYALPLNVYPYFNKNVVESVEASTSPSPTTVPQQIRTNVRERVQERVKVMLESERLRACQARQEAIKKRQESLLRLAAGHLKRMDNWTDRLKEFYNNKLLPVGVKVENYDQLLANIEEARDKAMASLDKASGLVKDFSCEGGDPKGLYNQFRETMQEVKNNLQAYRKAVKDLLVAIRKVAGEANSSPKPTATIIPTE